MESIKQEAEIAKAELEKQFEEQKQFLEKAVQEAEEWKRLLQEEERLRKQAETNLGSASGYIAPTLIYFNSSILPSFFPTKIFLEYQ